MRFPGRFFNTEGPVVPADHYSVPPLERMDLPSILTLIRQKRYFVLHAPRQTGKTSVLTALRDLLNSGTEGDFNCVLTSTEVGQAARENVSSAVAASIGMIATRARLLGDDIPTRLAKEVLADQDPHQAITELLVRWSMESPKPLVLLVDEIDALVGDSLLSVLRQLRTGYEQRPDGFPWSIVLCGVRDIQDYRIRSSSGEMIAGGSPFNVVAKSLRLGDFTQTEVQALVAQHTEETGQAFTDDALATLWEQTQGQPWLVNALCAEACFDDPAGTDRSRPITADAIWTARERLILSRRTHLDQLAHKLAEPRVRRVVEPMLAGLAEVAGAEVGNLERERDLGYARDLGLIAQEGEVRIANPIYAEVIPRELGHATQATLPQQAAWFVKDDGDLDVDKLLEAFQSFFRENSEHWLGRFDYQEAGPQLILQSYLQRIINGGGRIQREYGLGRGATDLLILWPTDPTQPSDLWRRIVIECKVAYAAQHRSVARIIEEGIEQTAGYMERCGADTGHLVVFDRRSGRDWTEKVFRREETHGERQVVVWGM